MSSPAANRALAHVAQRAAQSAPEAHANIARLLARHQLPEHLGRTIVASLTEHARVTLNFHPDRLGKEGLSIAESLARDGVYRSQFDTGVTNGSPTAFPGGERDRWEELLFGGAYHTDVPGGPVTERPKYGAFNVMGHADGGSPRFGSCYFELAPTVLPRCTFTWGDSHAGPEHVGTIEHFESILAAWLEAIDTTGAALGVSHDLPSLVERLSNPEHARVPEVGRAPGRALDDYIEAQVHGPIDLAKDIVALVIDPAFEGTDTEKHLEAMAARYRFPLRRHAGFVLLPSEVPSDFRGPRMRPLAERIAKSAEFDAATLGQAAQSLTRDPAQWQDWGTPEETWQELKQLWHVLVRFGRARCATAREPQALPAEDAP